MTTPASEPRIAYSVGEAAKACSLGRTFLYDQIAQGHLKSIKLGTRRLILHVDLMAFLSANIGNA